MDRTFDRERKLGDSAGFSRRIRDRLGQPHPEVDDLVRADLGERAPPDHLGWCAGRGSDSKRH